MRSTTVPPNRGKRAKRLTRINGAGCGWPINGRGRRQGRLMLGNPLWEARSEIASASYPQLGAGYRDAPLPAGQQGWLVVISGGSQELPRFLSGSVQTILSAYIAQHNRLEVRVKQI